MFALISLITVLIILFIICYRNTFINNNSYFDRFHSPGGTASYSPGGTASYSYDTARIPWNFNNGVSKLYGQTYFPGDSVYNTPIKYKGYPLWNRGHQFEYQNNMGNTMTNSYFLKSVINPLKV